MLEVIQIPVLPHNHNYNYVVREPVEGVVAAIDPSLVEPVLEVLTERGWRLDYILNTHHHWDHTDGNLALKSETGCRVVGFAGDAERIPGIDIRVAEGERFALGAAEAEIVFLPGHTRGHIAYYFAGSGQLFSGDVLFGMGCGRLFEGTPEEMYASLQRLAALPEDTMVYAAHEYTESNGRFALTVDPDNPALLARMEVVRALRAAGTPTVPFTIADEHRTNPFIRAGDAEAFALLRKQKDRF